MRGTVSGPPDDLDLVALRGRWCTAEARIYPLAMVSVPAYEQALTAVAVLLDVLRAEVHDEAALVAFHARPRAAHERLDPVALGGVGLRVDDLVDAACAARDRELAQLAALQRRVDAIRAAAAAGATWADIPAQRAHGVQATVPELRVHLEARRGLHSTLEPDAETGEPRLRVVPVRVDLETGELAVIDELEDLDLLVDDREAWDAAFAWFVSEWDLDVDARHHP